MGNHSTKNGLQFADNKENISEVMKGEWHFNNNNNLFNIFFCCLFLCHTGYVSIQQYVKFRGRKKIIHMLMHITHKTQDKDLSCIIHETNISKLTVANLKTWEEKVLFNIDIKENWASLLSNEIFHYVMLVSEHSLLWF